MRRLFAQLIIAILLLSLLNGCGREAMKTGTAGTGAETKQVTGSEETKTEQVSNTQQGSQKGQSSNTEQNSKKMMIKLYFGDQQAAELKEVSQELSLGTDSSKYASVFQALTKSPDPAYVPLWEGFKLIKAEQSGGLLTIDLKPDRRVEGSVTERLMLLSLLKTMFQFPEVEKVQILLDGQKAESLGGHIEILEPFTREMLEEL